MKIFLLISAIIMTLLAAGCDSSAKLPPVSEDKSKAILKPGDTPKDVMIQINK